MPTAIRTDWVHNSNDGFFYTHPAQKWSGISPLVGDASVTRPRTRAGLLEIPEMLAAARSRQRPFQAQLFADRNFMGNVIVPDLLAACTANPPASPKRGMAARRCAAGTAPTAWRRAARTCSASSGARRG
jgi:acyl-homoserine-lactone acylase